MAQGNGFDMQAMFGQDISGTTRYVGLSGAMAALGGDVSAVSDNPAALGIYRRSEALVTFDYQITQSLSPTNIDGRKIAGQNIRFPDIAWVFHFGSRTGKSQNNVMLQYRRLKSFNSEFHTFGSALNASQTDLMAWQANGLTSTDLDGANAYNDPDVGWLSKAGFDMWMIDPTAEDNRLWTSCEDGLADNRLMVTEDGTVDQYTLGWGIGSGNAFYLGLSMNILSLQYTKQNVYSELFASGNSYELRSYCANSGLGINAQLGVIGRPTDYWRVAAAIQSPTTMTIKTRSWGDANSKIYSEDSYKYLSYTSSSPYYDDRVRRLTPMRVVAGTAFQFGNTGLLSVEYDYQHGFEQYMVDEHMIKAGMEMVFKRNLFLDLGYACNLYGHHKTDEEAFLPGLNSARLDTDFRHYQPRHYASAGISLRTTHFVLGAAYQFSYQQQDLYAHYNQLIGADGLPTTLPNINTRTCTMMHHIVMTMAFRY